MHFKIFNVSLLALTKIFYIMSTGIVKFFNAKKGFGFIIDDETKEDIFVHSSGLIDEIQENDHVSFDIQEDSRGKKAVNVNRIDD